MYSIRTYYDAALVKIILAGTISERQVRDLARDLEQAVHSGDHPITGVLIDHTRADPLHAESLRLLGEIFARLQETNPVPVAQLLQSELQAHQLDRLADSQRTDGRLRHFWDSGSAMAWLSATAKSVRDP